MTDFRAVAKWALDLGDQAYTTLPKKYKVALLGHAKLEPDGKSVVDTPTIDIR